MTFIKWVSFKRGSYDGPVDDGSRSNVGIVSDHHTNAGRWPSLGRWIKLMWILGSVAKYLIGPPRLKFRPKSDQFFSTKSDLNVVQMAKIRLYPLL